jgi:hypothetical protein
MVQKIRKKIKKGPKAPHAVPLAIVMTALYGIPRDGRDFRDPFEDYSRLRAALKLLLDQEVIAADRVLSPSEYLDWGLKESPGRLVEMFLRAGTIPMGPAAGEEDLGSRPRLGILPVIAVVKGQSLDRFSETMGREWPEVGRVAFQNSIYPAFHLIPGYDLLLYAPLCHARVLNRGIEVLNRLTEDAFHQAGRLYPGPFDPLPDDRLSRIPLKEAFSG